MTASSIRHRLARLSPADILVITGVFLIADVGDQLVKGPIAQGPLDETAHLLTTLLVLWAIGGAVYERLLIPALVASVAIDLDHIPAYLGTQFWTEGTPRPYTHSLATIILVLGLTVVWPRRRTVLVAVAVGLAIHLWRDMAEPGSGVALMWPLSDASWSLSHLSYLLVMALVVGVGLRRSFAYRPRAMLVGGDRY